MRKSLNNESNNHSLIKISHISLKSESTDHNHATTKSYVDSLSEKERQT